MRDVCAVGPTCQLTERIAVSEPQQLTERTGADVRAEFISLHHPHNHQHRLSHAAGLSGRARMSQSFTARCSSGVCCR